MVHMTLLPPDGVAILQHVSSPHSYVTQWCSEVPITLSTLHVDM